MAAQTVYRLELRHDFLECKSHQVFTVQDFTVDVKINSEIFVESVPQTHEIT